VGRGSCNPNVPAFIVHQGYDGEGGKKDTRMKSKRKRYKGGEMGGDM